MITTTLAATTTALTVTYSIIMKNNGLGWTLITELPVSNDADVLRFAAKARQCCPQVLVIKNGQVAAWMQPSWRCDATDSRVFFYGLCGWRCDDRPTPTIPTLDATYTARQTFR